MIGRQVLQLTPGVSLKKVAETQNLSKMTKTEVNASCLYWCERLSTL